MAARQAKVSIGLDYKPLRQDVRDAKKMLADIGNAKIDPALRNNIRKIIDRDVFTQAESFKKKITEITGELRKMGQASAASVDTAGIQRAVRELSKYQSALRDIRQQQRGMAQAPVVPSSSAVSRPPSPAPLSNPVPDPGSATGGGGDAGGPGLGRRLLGGAKGALGALGIGFGAAAAFSRTEALAQAGMRVRSLTGGNSVGGSSSLGFTDMNRLERAKEIASQSGRDMGQPEITTRVDKSERMERAYGISGSQYAGTLGTAKKAGVGDQEGFIAGAVGDAVAMKLSGSAIGDYLSAMTGFLGSISKGVDIKQGSLRGFASSLGSIDFFKTNPERIFDMMGKLDRLFKGGGDEFQNFSSYRAIQDVGGGADKIGPAGVQVRRTLGTYGGGKGSPLAKKARGEGMEDLASVIEIEGKDVTKKMLTDAFETANIAGSMGGKKDNTASAAMFQNMSDGTDQSGLEVYLEMSKNKRLGKKDLLPDSAFNAYKEANKSPEERSADAMRNFDGSVVKFGKDLDDVQNVIAKGITEGMLWTKGFAEDIGLFKGATSLFDSAVKMFVEGFNPPQDSGGAEDAKGSDRSNARIDYQMKARKQGFNLSADEEDYLLSQEESANQKVGGKLNKNLWRGTKIQERAQAGKFEGMKESLSTRDLYNSTMENLPGMPGMSGGGRVRRLALAGGGGVSWTEAREKGWTPTEETERTKTPFAFKDRNGNFYKMSFFDGKYYKVDRDSDDYDSIETQWRKYAEKRGFAEGGNVGHNPQRGFRRGGAAMGTDKINAKLTDGEFVVNARSASSNMMALVHANSGGKIRPYADGGAVGDSIDALTGSIPGSIGLDSGMMESALSGNTKALMMLAQVLSGKKSGATMRTVPRGSPGVKYG